MQAVMAVDTLLSALVRSGNLTQGAAAGIRANVNRAYDAVRDPNAYRPSDFRRSIGADSLGYVSLDGLISATQVPSERLCSACFTGEYPMSIPEDMSEGKLRLEITEVHGH